MRLLFSRPASHPPRRRHRRRSRAGAAERPRLGAAPPRRTSPSPRLASSSGRPVSLVAVGGAEHAGSRHMATGPDLSSSSSFAAAPDAVSLVAEDGVLRSQITIHGTDNWTIIAAQFRDKTARQCRRRWYNYLNSECKKGGGPRKRTCCCVRLKRFLATGGLKLLRLCLEELIMQ